MVHSNPCFSRNLTLNMIQFTFRFIIRLGSFLFTINYLCFEQKRIRSWCVPYITIALVKGLPAEIVSGPSGQSSQIVLGERPQTRIRNWYVPYFVLFILKSHIYKIRTRNVKLRQIISDKSPVDKSTAVLTLFLYFI